MKRFILILISVLLILSLLACGGNKDNTGDENPNGGGNNGDSETPSTPDAPNEPETPETPETPESPEAPDDNGAVNESEWNEIVSADNFDNYTVMMEGIMEVVENGVNQGKSDLMQKIKVADGKVSIELFFEGESVHTDVLEGDMAATQKTQASQLFIVLLNKFDNFVYDADNDVYRLAETITINTTLKGISYNPDGSVLEFDVPAVIEMRDAKVTLSDDGKLASFICDYTQTMNMPDGDVVSTSGITTWTFSDFGATVIE